MVEAQAAGCPVIAYGQGGALEIIQEGQTGLLFHKPTVDQVVTKFCVLNHAGLSFPRRVFRIMPGDLIKLILDEFSHLFLKKKGRLFLDSPNQGRDKLLHCTALESQLQPPPDPLCSRRAHGRLTCSRLWQEFSMAF
jgi:hypothetical protein